MFVDKRSQFDQQKIGLLFDESYKQKIEKIPPQYLYIQLKNKHQTMSSEEISTELAENLRDLVGNQFNYESTLILLANKQETVQQIFANLLVRVLVGQKQALEVFFAWYQTKNLKSPVQVEQNALVQWISSNIKEEMINYISEEYDKIFQIQDASFSEIYAQLQVKIQQGVEQAMFIQDQVKIQHQIQETHINLNNNQQQEIADQAISLKSNQSKNASSLFEVISICEEYKKQPVSQKQQCEKQIMIYTHEQMINELKFQLEGTPANTVTSKKYHEQQEEQEQNMEHQNQIQHEREVKKPIQNYFNFSQYEVYELYNDDSVIQDSKDYGHFLNGDKIDQIIEVFYYQDQQYATIKWKNRSEGLLLKNSTFLTEDLKYHSPHQLISFYQQKFQALTR